MSAAPSAISPENLPHVWRAPELARGAERVTGTGHAALDRELPGGGWPRGHLVEIVQASAGRHVWQLLLPALAQAASEEGGPIVVVDPPHLPFAPALRAQGLAPERLLRLVAQDPKRALWATEQALRCADVAAVMAWLPRVRGPELRRLHLAAAQQGRLLFAFRGPDARGDSSPARVRLEIEEGEALRVRLLKRRGPPLAQAIELPSHPMRLQRLLDSRKRGVVVPLNLPATPEERSHGLDRALSLA